MNEKEDAPDVLNTSLPSLHLYATIISKVIGERIATTIAATSNPTSLTLT